MLEPRATEPHQTLADRHREVLDQRARRYARRVDEAVGQVTSLMVFERGGSRFAAPLEALREVRALQRFCPIPGARPTVPGIVHHRGALLSVHDLSHLFGRTAPDDPRWLVVVEHGAELVGVLADELVGVAAVSELAIGQVPVTLGSAGAVLMGALADGTLLVHPQSLFAHRDFFFAF